MAHWLVEADGTVREAHWTDKGGALPIVFAKSAEEALAKHQGKKRK